MSSELPPNSGLEQRVQRIVPRVEPREVADVLAAQRDQILRTWLDATALQSFHAGRRQGVVADHIPRLFDAVVALLKLAEYPAVRQVPPLNDPAVLAAAQDHARARFEQGLQPADIVTEFRLLRQEIGRALWANLGDSAPTSDVVGAELIVHDALDGAITLALHALTTHIEEVREDFLATTIHDTRQPLSGIKGWHQLIARALDRPDLDRERLREHLRRASAEVDRMDDLLSTLAEVSRLALGRLTLRVISVDLSALIRDAVDRLPPDVSQRIRLRLPTPNAARGDWDPLMLDRVIANLLSNAIKYSPQDSPVEVAIEVESDQLHVTVRDFGIGLDSDDLAWLFRRYGRARGASRQGIQGLGLGLYLSHGIVDAHGGRLWAESAGLGHGTTMHLQLPRSTPPPPAELRQSTDTARE